MKRIVVTLDQSVVSESALPLARGLASMTGAAVSLVTVVDVPASLPDQPTGMDVESGEEPRDDPRAMRASLPIEPGSPGAEVSPEDVDRAAAAQREASEYLDRIAETFEGATVDRHVLYGEPVDRIIEALEQRSTQTIFGPDDEPIIVMASHGRTGLGRVLVGSVAWRVIQRADAPVFLVRGRDDAQASEGEQGIQRVLAAVDGSFFSEKVLLAIRQAFGDAGIAVHVIRVVEPDDEDARAEATRYLESIADWMSSQGYETTWEIGEGDVDVSINQAAESSGADVIALATHGRMGVSRLRIGSVAEKVVQNTTKPLMLIRPWESS